MKRTKLMNLLAVVLFVTEPAMQAAEPIAPMAAPDLVFDEMDGELYTFFFSSDEGTLKDGKYTLDAPGNFRFGRDESDFAVAF